MANPGLISVRTDVVLDVLIGSVARAVRQRMSDPLPVTVEAALPRAVAVAVAGAPAPEAAAIRIARAGWHARGVERERFDRACEPDVLVDSMLTGVDACAELASREPLDRPHPDDRDAITWRVPGPGGHVRHYVAEHAIAELSPAQPMAALKRCWVYGFLLACTPADALQ